MYRAHFLQYKTPESGREWSGQATSRHLDPGGCRCFEDSAKNLFSY